MTSRVPEARAMLAKATPGPWEAIEHKAVSNNDYIQILAGSWDIAHSKFSARRWEEEQANATLIAAAPALLADLCSEIEALREHVRMLLATEGELHAEAKADAVAALEASND